MSARRLAGFVLASLLTLVGCATTDHLIDERTYQPPGPALVRVAVIPFYAHRSYESSSRLGSTSAELATQRVTRQMVESLLEAGVEIVPIDEVANALEQVPRSTAVIDSLIFAEAAGGALGATSVLIGEVLRYRDARGATENARHPASVAFQVTLYAAPDAHKLWTARYDYTQVPPQQNTGSDAHDAVLKKRWMTAHEIAQRGTDAVAKALANLR